MEETAAQERIRQLFLIVAGDQDDRSIGGFDRFFGLIDKEFHAIEFLQQVIGELDVGFVYLINQQHGLDFRFKRLPQLAFHDVVADVIDPVVTELRIAQTRHRVVFIQATRGLGSGLNMPLDEWPLELACDFLGQHGLAGTGFAFDQQGSLERDRGIDRHHEIIGRDVGVGSRKAHRGHGSFHFYEKCNHCNACSARTDARTSP